MNHNLLRVADVADRLGTTTTTIYRWIRDGAFPPGRLIGPRARVWTEADLDEHLATARELAEAQAEAKRQARAA